MELERDSDFRWKATRRSRKQVANLASSVGSPPSMGMSPSPSSTFRSFFGRKNSSTTTGTATGGSMPSPALTTSSQLEGTLESAMLSPTLSNHSVLLGASTASVNTAVQGGIPPFYGGKSDSGGEVRYSVEIVRVRGLTGIYTLDFRRMKGSLSDYRANHVCPVF
jgi:protein-serine/threonine kinase